MNEWLWRIHTQQWVSLFPLRTCALSIPSLPGMTGSHSAFTFCSSAVISSERLRWPPLHRWSPVHSSLPYLSCSCIIIGVHINCLPPLQGRLPTEAAFFLSLINVCLHCQWDDESRILRKYIHIENGHTIYIFRFCIGGVKAKMCWWDGSDVEAFASQVWRTKTSLRIHLWTERNDFIKVVLWLHTCSVTHECHLSHTYIMYMCTVVMMMKLAQKSKNNLLPILILFSLWVNLHTWSNYRIYWYFSDYIFWALYAM